MFALPIGSDEIFSTTDAKAFLFHTRYCNRQGNLRSKSESGREEVREKVSFEVRIIAAVSHSPVLRCSLFGPPPWLLGTAKLAYRWAPFYTRTKRHLCTFVQRSYFFFVRLISLIPSGRIYVISCLVANSIIAKYVMPLLYAIVYSFIDLFVQLLTKEKLREHGETRSPLNDNRPTIDVQGLVSCEPSDEL